jgi:2-(1,2-epoxy-1,2-dihydrophenyl)acetyl-CoA isomerase
VPDAVQTRLADGILRVTLARPEKKNALDLETLAAIRDALQRARDDPAALDRLRGGLNTVAQLLHDIPTPVIAQVQGNAYGAGAILALQCDLALAAEQATFALSFRHVGLIPDTGATWLLPRLVGLQRAKYLAWTGAPFTAKDAAEWGLIHRAVPKQLLAGEVASLASALAEGPAATIGLAKQAFNRNLGVGLAEALDREARLQAQAFLTREHAEGRDAFFDRRKPDFRRGTQ